MDLTHAATGLPDAVVLGDAEPLGADLEASAEPASDAVRRRLGARSASRTRLLSALVVWDALVPAALVVIGARFQGDLGAPLNGGAAAIDDPLVLMLAVMSPLALAISGAYHQRRRRGGSRLLFAMRLAVVGMAVSWIALVSCAAAGWPVDVAQMLALSLLLPPAWLVGRWASDRHPATGPERVLLVGSGAVARRVAELTARHRERRLDIVGRVESGASAPDGGGPPLLGDLGRLPEIVEAEGIERVIVAFGPERDSALLDSLRDCVGAGVEVDVVPRLFDLVGPSPRSHSIGGLALVEVPGRGLTPAQRVAKRGLDVVGSLLLIAVLAPVLVAVASVVAVADGRPVLFRQTRVGTRGRAFLILKYRTMRADADAAGVPRLAAEADAGTLPLEGGATQIAALVRELKARGDLRVTRLGALLRRTSLDELPQLFNVLRGEMSLVGPRPLRPFEAAALAPWQLARQELRPGLTGLWQVLGRSDIEWEERMQLDYTYVAHWSFASDLRILARTLPAVIQKDGAV